jgi:hypothetical protein
VLAVWRLDRLRRSLKHVIELMAELEAERIAIGACKFNLSSGGWKVEEFRGRRGRTVDCRRS